MKSKYMIGVSVAILAVAGLISWDDEPRVETITLTDDSGVVWNNSVEVWKASLIACTAESNATFIEVSPEPASGFAGGRFWEEISADVAKKLGCPTGLLRAACSRPSIRLQPGTWLSRRGDKVSIWVGSESDYVANAHDFREQRINGSLALAEVGTPTFTKDMRSCVVYLMMYWPSVGHRNCLVFLEKSGDEWKVTKVLYMGTIFCFGSAR